MCKNVKMQRNTKEGNIIALFWPMVGKKKLRFLISISILLLLMPILGKPGAETPQNISLDLPTAVRLGIQNDFILNTANDKIKIVEWVTKEKWRQFLPKVGVSYFGLNNLNINQADSNYNDVRLTIQQLVYDGKSILDLKVAQVAETLTREDIRMHYFVLRTQINKAYIEALAAKKGQFLAEKAFSEARIVLKESKVRFNLGMLDRRQYIEALTKAREMEFKVFESRYELENKISALKESLNINYETEISLEDDLLKDFKVSDFAIDEDPLIEGALKDSPPAIKSRLKISQIREALEQAENGWLPKLSVGGYYGYNSNKGFPLNHPIYGMNFSVGLNLWGNNLSASDNAGIQNAGQAIQPYPGFGNVSVGQGRSNYQRGSISILDDLSYVRKIWEKEIGLQEAIDSHKKLENKIGMNIQSKISLLKAHWMKIRSSNSKVLGELEKLRITILQFRLNHATPKDIIAAEKDLLDAETQLTLAFTKYLETVLDMELSAAKAPYSLQLASYEKGRGNSLAYDALEKRNSLAEFAISNLHPSTNPVDSKNSPNVSDEPMVTDIEQLENRLMEDDNEMEP